MEVIWHSFQLNPTFQPVPGESIYEAVAKKQGVSPAEVRSMGADVTKAAEEVGLRYDSDRNIPANTFLAHQLIHLKDTNLFCPVLADHLIPPVLD